MRKIVYIRSNNFEGIESGLAERFDVEAYPHLTADFIDWMEKRREEGKTYNALVTNVPHRLPTDILEERPLIPLVTYTSIYYKGLELLQDIKKRFPEMKIVAYTGADKISTVELIFKFRGPVDEIVFKSGDWKEDLKKIKKELESLLA